MTKDQFSTLLAHIQSEEFKVREDGQREYCHTDDNIFANFDDAAESLGGTRIDDLMHHALKHWRGICAYVKGHRSQREDIRGRIKDLRMYMALLWGMIDEEKVDDTIIRQQRHSRPIPRPICTEPDCNNPRVCGNVAGKCAVHAALDRVNDGVDEAYMYHVATVDEHSDTSIEEGQLVDVYDSGNRIGQTKIIRLGNSLAIDMRRMLCSCLKQGTLEDQTVPYERTTQPFGRESNVLANGKCDKCYGTGFMSPISRKTVIDRVNSSAGSDPGKGKYTDPSRRYE